MPADAAEVVDLLSSRLEELLATCGVKRWMSLESAAVYCDLSTETLRKLISTGRLVPHRPVPGKLLLDRVELTEYIASTRGAPGPVGRGRHRTTVSA